MHKSLALIIAFYLSFSSLCIGQISQPFGELLFEDSLSFDPIHEWITIPSPEENIWQIGQAKKQFLDSSLTRDPIIITDTAESYPPLSDDNFFVSIPTIGNWYTWAEGILSFYHKYQTDSMKDGGLIEITYDGGITWGNVLFDNSINNPSQIGLYSESDTLSGGQPAFTGTVNDWIYTELHWVWFAFVKKSTGDMDGLPILRFRFISDSTDNNKDGWLIDRMVFRGYSVSGSVGESAPEHIRIYPNPVGDYLQINATNNPDNAILHLFGTDGRLVLSTEIEARDQIDVSDLTPGIYLWNLEKVDCTIESGKFIKH